MKALNYKKSIKKYKSTDKTASSVFYCFPGLHRCFTLLCSFSFLSEAHTRRVKVSSFIMPLSRGETEHSNRKTSQRELVKVMSTVAISVTRTLSSSDLISMIRALVFSTLHSLYIGFLDMTNAQFHFIWGDIGLHLLGE